MFILHALRLVFFFHVTSFSITCICILLYNSINVFVSYCNKLNVKLEPLEYLPLVIPYGERSNILYTILKSAVSLLINSEYLVSFFSLKSVW